MKQYNGRWYLIAQAEGVEQLHVYPIDRIKKVELWKKSFKPPVIDLKEHFENTSGVSVSADPVERIVLKINNSRYPYVETKPFSEEQKIVSHDAENHVIVFPMRINKELVSTLLSFGDDLEVLEPQCLRGKMAEKIKAMNEKYASAQKDCTEEV